VSECDLKTSTMRRPRHIRAVEPWEKEKDSGDICSATDGFILFGSL
jgi:hypothetical protein